MKQTITEKIFSEHVGREVFAGEIIESDIDMVIGNDITTPISIKQFERSGATKISSSVFNLSALILSNGWRPTLSKQ
mgnify:CR=1 FL=1